MDKLIKLIKGARFVFVAGNGGSAATAEHFTNDLFSKGIRAICLNSNVSIMTMIGNDFGYEDVYSRQLSVYGSGRDLLITISCSGTSPNVVKAIKVAKILGIKTYEFETFIDSVSGVNDLGHRDYEKLEDKHLILAHKIKKAL